MGLSKTQYGFLMFTMSLSYITGTFMCRRLLVRWGVRRTVAVAGGMTLTAGTTMALLAIWHSMIAICAGHPAWWPG